MPDEKVRKQPHYGHYALQWMGYTVFFMYLVAVILSYLYLVLAGVIVAIFGTYLITSYMIGLRILDQHNPFPPPKTLKLTGEEHVLDIGCGLGKMTVGIAKKLTTGKVTGLDLWVSAEIPGNSPERAKKNAQLEAVEDRVEFESGDVRSMQFNDSTFDVVTALTLMNNIRGHEDKMLALSEILRVLKPDCQFLLVEVPRDRWGMLMVTPLMYWSMLKKEQWIELLEEVGFVDISYERYRKMTTILARKPAR
ncbi:MAG: methyltransferase domain-containing protein [Candidatus Lokiarchaeota archaeon]|nr:methyltransferase domain-containing protein [Candidatus Lokiarchaeota archaeon]